MVKRDSTSTSSDCIVSGFDGVGSQLLWYCQPDAWSVVEGQREGRGGSWEVKESTLRLRPPAMKDYWRRTYYEPAFEKDDGPFLYTSIPLGNFHFTVETSFTLTASQQFDQAGLMVRVGPEHWLKTGIEFVDRRPRLSCVVTNIYSDWSTQSWPTDLTSESDTNSRSSADIRVHCRGESFVVEAKTPRSNVWEFIRIAHLSQNVAQANYDRDSARRTSDDIWAGVFGCCPEDQQGGLAVFHKLLVSKGSSFDHNADGNTE